MSWVPFYFASLSLFNAGPQLRRVPLQRLPTNKSRPACSRAQFMLNRHTLEMRWAGLFSEIALGSTVALHNKCSASQVTRLGRRSVIISQNVTRNRYGLFVLAILLLS